jgi:hypothetical protein
MFVMTEFYNKYGSCSTRFCLPLATFARPSLGAFLHLGDAISLLPLHFLEQSKGCAKNQTKEMLLLKT